MNHAHETKASAGKIETPAAEAAATGRWCGQQPAYLRVRHGIGAVVVVALAAVAIGFYFVIPVYPLWLLGSLLGALTIIALVGLWYSTAAFGHYAFCLDDVAVHRRQGVFWRKETVVPLCRVQHTDVIRGPLQRRYGLATLVIHTAGTRHAVVNLVGISQPQAVALREYMTVDADSGAV